VRAVEDDFIEILRGAGVDFVSSLPCEKVKGLLLRVKREGMHVPLTREEEGVGISAGAALAGRRPAMIIQSSGFGNMVNALLSLTGFYCLPLAVFISHRGLRGEKIAAQVPMGRALPGLLRAAGIGYTTLRERADLSKMKGPLKAVYDKGKAHAFLLHPGLWEGCSEASPSVHEGPGARERFGIKQAGRRPKPSLTRYEVIKTIAPYLRGSPVVANIGFPSKELFSVLHQPSNFYMLGSMGMASPIGLGLALGRPGKVFVIDGDGSLLMNPGTLATVALMAPTGLTIVAVDNGAYGSTGNQPTHTRYVTDLSVVAQGFGIRNTALVAEQKELVASISSRARGPRFIHVIARPGNAEIPNIPLEAVEIKRQFMKALGSWA
jgi:sulfopyruvate decarboxylase beta subunit